MKVILLDNIKGVGKKDEIINASDGYARNYLFPKKLAVEANSENLSKLNNKKEAANYKKDVEKKNAEELRAYGQHYGLPTNYLDFTEAHLISLLFAVEDFEYTDNHSIVYFVDALSYNRDNVKAERKLVDFSDDEMKASLEREYSDKSYFIRVGNCNERIHFQKGCFLRVEHRDTLDRMFEKYTKIAIIDKDCKENILKELFKLGITFENIYPDKDNMVRTIKFIKEHM